MITIETLTLIALWCGNPVNSTKGSMGFKSGSDLYISQINECRKELIECVETATKTVSKIGSGQQAVPCFVNKKSQADNGGRGE